MLLVSPNKRGAHHMPTLHLQKALLIDRLADFKGLKLAHQVRDKLRSMQNALLAELSVYRMFL